MDASSEAVRRSAIAERILDLALDRIQRRGYNAVSYGHLTDELDLPTAAITTISPRRLPGQGVLIRR